MSPVEIVSKTLSITIMRFIFSCGAFSIIASSICFFGRGNFEKNNHHAGAVFEYNKSNTNTNTVILRAQKTNKNSRIQIRIRPPACKYESNIRNFKQIRIKYQGALLFGCICFICMLHCPQHPPADLDIAPGWECHTHAHRR